MVKVYTSEEYSIAYAELLEILKYLDKSDLSKIPKDILLRYIKDKDVNYNFSYNPTLEIAEQNVSRLTLILLANLYIDYLADANESAYIKNQDMLELHEIEKQEQEKYDISNIFNEKSIKSHNNSACNTTSLTLVNTKTNIIKKIFEKIKNFFKVK